MPLSRPLPRVAQACLGGLALLVLACWLAPLLGGPDPHRPDWSWLSSPPSFATGHWFGTDAIGRDVLEKGCKFKGKNPIAVNRIAMGAGMLPLALGFSGDASFRAPMAWAVIGGLITSTALSLIVIPAAYTVLHDIGDWFVRRFSRKRAAGDVASAH